MKRKKAVITDGDRASAKSIAKKLSELGYQVIIAGRLRSLFCRYEVPDLLIEFTSVYSEGKYVGTEVSDRGHIIRICRLSPTAEKLRNELILRSYGEEQLLRERYLGSEVHISYIRSGEGWNGDIVGSGLHDLSEGSIADKVAETAAHFT